MKYATLGRSGLRVSTICLGSATFGVAPRAEEATSLVAAALDLGINFFDTANSYGNQPRFDRDGVPPAAERASAEELLGTALVGRRHEAIIGTKVQEAVGPGANDRGLSRKHILQQAERSLRRLQTDYIDVYYAHHPDPTTPIEETIDAFDTLVTQGKVRYWAVSGFPVWRLMQAYLLAEKHRARLPICHQVGYNLVNRTVELEVVPACLDLGLSLTAFGPLGGGLLSSAENLERDDVGSQRWGGSGFSAGQVAFAQQMQSVAREAGCHPAQLAIAWLLRRPAVACAVIGSTRPSSLLTSAVAADLELPDAVFERLDTIPRP